MDAVVDGDVQGGPSAHSAAAAMIFLGDVQGGAASGMLPPVGGASQPAYSQHAANAGALMESTEAFVIAEASDDDTESESDAGGSGDESSSDGRELRGVGADRRAI